ncbi:MAG: vWA domain-containing protein [Verrucomicrobiales bacterium]
MNNSKLTELVFVLDRSGSMQGMEEPAVDSYNRFLNDQKSVEGDANLTLMLFDTEFDKPVNCQSINEVPEMVAGDFRPRGMTALLDAIGLSIRETRRRIKAMPEEERPGKVIFAIFTDGYENSSRRYNWEQIARKISKRTIKDGWEFLFLAANQDAVATAAKMNIDEKNASMVMYCKEGMSSWGGGVSRKARAIREQAMDMAYCKLDMEAPLESIVKEEMAKEKEKPKEPSPS